MRVVNDAGLTQFIPFDPPKPRPFAASINDFQKVRNGAVAAREAVAGRRL
jgi:hypothetical protein